MKSSYTNLSGYVIRRGRNLKEESNFIQRRSTFSQNQTWTVKTVEHSKQFDSTSCGVYVLKFAENFLNDKSLMLQWTKDDIVEERKRIALKIMQCGYGHTDKKTLPNIGRSVQKCKQKRRSIRRKRTSEEMDAFFKENEQTEEEEWERSMTIPVLQLEKVPPLLWPEDVDDNGNSVGSENREAAKISMGEIEETIGKLYSTLTLLAAGKVSSPLHDSFMKGSRSFTCGFGLTEFKTETFVALEVWLTKTFLKDVRKDLFTTWSTVRGAGTDLLARLKESSICGKQYLNQVIMKETITRIMMENRDITWKEAVIICSATESSSWPKSLKLAMKQVVKVTK